MKYKIAVLCLFLIGLGTLSCTSSTEKNTSNNDKKSLLKGVYVYTNLIDAQKQAAKSKKPLFLIFDCPIACSYRKSTTLLFDYLRTHSKIEQNYEIVYLPLDDRTPIKSSKEIIVNGQGERVKTIGQENSWLLIQMFHVNGTPYHLLTDRNLKPLKEPFGSFANKDEVRNYLSEPN